MNRYRPFARITVTALVVLAGVFVTVRVLRDDLADLTTEWAPAATIVDVGARGAANDHLEAIVAAGESEGPLTFGPYTINEQTAAAPLRQPTAPRDGVSGRVPEWFPVLDGAVQLSAEFSGQSEDPDTLASSDTAEPGLPSTYMVTQTSLVATDLTSEEVATAITDAVGDWWPEFTEDTVSDYDWYETSMNSRRDGNNPDDVASIDIAAAGSAEFDGLVIVEVKATYHEAQRLRQQPLTAIALDLSELASDETWPMAAWSLGTGWLGYGAVATEHTIVTWAIDSSPAAAADAVVEVLGTPDDGDVDSSAANLVYGDGEVRVEGLEQEQSGQRDAEQRLLVWRSQTALWTPAPPGPLAESSHGVPVVTVDVDSRRPVTAGFEPRPTLDAIEDFQQFGMIAIDGAMSTHTGSGVDGVGDTYTARPTSWCSSTPPSPPRRWPTGSSTSGSTRPGWTPLRSDRQRIIPT